MTQAERQPALLADPRFARFALAKLLQLTAQNALVYGLFILVVQQQESAVVTSVFVLTATLPSVVLSLPGGVASDMAPVKFSLTWTLLLRIAIAWVFLREDTTLSMVLLLTLLNWCVYQFYSPAESASVPALVPAEVLGRATAILQAVSLLAQLAGAGVLAPLTIKLFGADTLFACVLLLLSTAAALLLSIPRLTPPRRAPRQRPNLIDALPAGLRTLSASDVMLRATVFRIVMDSAMSMLVVAAPVFLTDVLDTAAENAVYVAAPGAIGLAIGLVLAPVLTTVMGTRLVLWSGFLLGLFAIGGLAFVAELATGLRQATFLPLGWLQDSLGLRPEIATAMLLIPFGGLGISLVQVTSRLVVYQAAPADQVAQVFAAQSGLGSLGSLLPTLLSGILLDLLPVRVVLILIVGCAFLAVLAVRPPRQPASRASPPSAPPTGPAGESSG